MSAECLPARSKLRASVPRIISRDRTRHAMRGAATAHQLATRECVRPSLGGGNVTLGLQKILGGNHLEAGFLQFSQCCLVSRVTGDDTRTQRSKVATRRPLLPILDDP